MNLPIRRKSGFITAYVMLDLVFHSIVRSIRKTHRNAVLSILMNMLQMAVMVFAFYILFSLLGLKGSAIRGDFMLYIMSGIFLYMTHSKTFSAVAGAEGPASPMMQHAPMNTIVAILAAAFSTLYIQVMSLVTILFIYHIGFVSITIDQPVAAFGMLLLAWFTGLGLGIVLLAIKPWFPTFVKVFVLIYMRANMIASGKMFVANSLPPMMLVLFDWNPLFHCIDQSRGFAFINYMPRNSSIIYPLLVGIILVMVGLMGEFYTRKHASASWEARR